MTAPVILLVEDSPGLGVVVPALGRRSGWAVEWRGDTGTAWDSLQGDLPDLVLLDVHLPGPSGLELCRRIRVTPRTERLAVALFTHWGMPEDVAEGLEAGADYLVCKDLVGHPERWRRRLADILPPEHGQRRLGRIGWNSCPAEPLGSWPARLHEALRHPALRGVGPEVMRVVLRRALAAAFTPAPAGAVLPDGRTLDAARLPASPRPEELVRLVTSLAGQVWCLMGTEDSAPLWPALALLVPGCPELPTHA
jgi:CheY-like chemotaxis protein